MNSLRPLITIAILGVVGVLLYVQINKGPARHDHGHADAGHDHAVEGVPPLAATVGSPASDAGTAPKWPTTAPPLASTSQPAPPVVQPVPLAADTAIPEMPAIPALPEVSPMPQPVTPSAANPAPLNASPSVAQGRYPDAADTAAAGTTTPPVPVQPVPADFPADDGTAIGSAPLAAAQTAPPAAIDHENSIATESAMAAVGIKAQPVSDGATPGNIASPLAQQPAPQPDRYGLGATVPTEGPLPQAAAAPVESTFTAAWPEIQAALDRGELARAHQLLSKWYGDNSLTTAEAEKVETLLGQLAGTVVYSTEHQLEPAHAVKPGENLETVANSYNVPWKLLAKINGVPSVDAVQPGQKLKVVRGPFSAVVDVRRSQLTLLLDGRYAGKFPITVPTGAAVTEGSWLVDQKLVTAPVNVTQTSYTPAPAAVDRAIVLRGEDASTGKPAATGPTLTIASAVLTTGAEVNQPAIHISAQDAEELSDILSIGSRVTVRK